MTVAKNRLMSLEEYLDYDDGTDARYELIDGIVIEMGAEANINTLIEGFLFSFFLQFVPHYCIRPGNTEIAVTGRHANTRFPDVMVLTEEGAAALLGSKRATVMFEMPAPALVVEVVSSSDTNEASRQRDYGRKKTEYAQRGIAEYWIVDPIEAAVWVLTLIDRAYQERKFSDDERLVSPTFPNLALSAKQVLTADQQS